MPPAWELRVLATTPAEKSLTCCFLKCDPQEAISIILGGEGDQELVAKQMWDARLNKVK